MDALRTDSIPPKPETIAAGVTELVTLPAVYLEVRRVVNDPEAGIVDLARVVSTDAAIAARLLRVANSAAYRTLRDIGTLSQAVAVLGMQRVHELALASALASVFEGLPVEDANMASFWARSISGAAMARSIAARVDPEEMERVFVQGLLCEVGHLAMFVAAPQSVQAVLARVPLTDAEIWRRERDVLGFDHADVGAELLRAWSLPDSLVEVIGAQASPSSAGTQAVICHVAWQAAAALSAGEDMLERISGLDVGLCSALGQSTDSLESALMSGIDDAEELREMFFPALAA